MNNLRSDKGESLQVQNRSATDNSTPLPSINVTNRHAREIIDEAAEALFAANDRAPQLYARKRQLYREKSGGFFLAEWIDLRSVLVRSANFFKTAEDGTAQPTSLPDGHLSLLRAHLLDNVQRFPKLPDSVVIGMPPAPIPYADEEEETL